MLRNKLLNTLAFVVITVSALGQKPNVESIKKSLEPTSDNIESYKLSLPDFRWGFQFQGFVGDMADEENITLGTYLKYKPYYRFDMDAGFKVYSARLNDNLRYAKDDFEYAYSNFKGTQFYLAVNSSLALNKLNSPMALYSSLEVGYASNKSDVRQLNIKNSSTNSEIVRDGKMYFEWKLGLNIYGDFLGENTGVKVFVGFNNVPYSLSAHNHRIKNGITSNSYSSASLLMGVSFEFGLKKSASQKANKIKLKQNRSIIDKYHDPTNRQY